MSKSNFFVYFTTCDKKQIVKGFETKKEAEEEYKKLRAELGGIGYILIKAE